MSRLINKETKKQIFDEYVNSDKPVKAIAADFGVSKAAVSEIVKRMGGELRHPKKPQGDYKKCPACKRLIKLEGIPKYCPFCATDIRSERELLWEKTNKLFAMLIMLPESQRDEAQSIVTDLSDYLKRGDK